MELRQLRYFVRIVELGAMSRAAAELDMVQSALSQQISRLESELSTRLLQRTPRGVLPTEAGMAFFREAKLTLRHAEQAVRAAQAARLSGSVSVGLAPTTAAVLGLPLMQAMRERYPDVRLHLVEGMSGHLAAQLKARELDLAVLFDPRAGQGGPVPGDRLMDRQPLFTEDIFLVTQARRRRRKRLALADLGDEPLILPTHPHGLRLTLDAAFARAGIRPQVVMEVDSLSMVMAAVDAGLGSSLQPYAAVHGVPDAQQRLRLSLIDDAQVRRTNLLCSLSEDELSPAALATRVVVVDCVKRLIGCGAWPGTRLWSPDRLHKD
ncbi:LysR family transcriptional regulator [Hydrogenophaga sp. YM1]|uniref:LysR family transcriptional regulator n=1 Tax=Hydrogenophaga sp. YM1 TaxID=2806262 RepID=UPI0019590D45|nr:LysR substrate-binding domain-containing protein [Hydrogenophaga sp. YM1]QRR33965.1 LysR family transcriptional regulator [Hydrogenophaga sp. YM1]